MRVYQQPSWVIFAEKPKIRPRFNFTYGNKFWLLTDSKELAIGELIKWAHDQYPTQTPDR
jgi:hypothetical protein